MHKSMKMKKLPPFMRKGKHYEAMPEASESKPAAMAEPKKKAKKVKAGY